MRDLLLAKDHYLGRFVAQIAHGAGVPMTLFRLCDDLTLPSAHLTSDGFTTFVDRVKALEDPSSVAEWMATFRSEAYRVYASGRRYEHPFVTLLRNEAWWSIWEMTVLRERFLRLSGEGHRLDVVLPGTLGELIQIKVEIAPALNGVMVYGPVPRERGSSADISRSISRFVEAAQLATDLSGSPKGGGFSSSERLRRMYFANGRIVDKLFASNVERASEAIRQCLGADVGALRLSDDFDPSTLPTLDKVATVALTRVEHPSSRSIRFRGPASMSRGVEILSEKTGDLRISILAPGAAAGPLPAEAAGIELSASSSGQIADTLQDVIAKAEDRNAQAVLQQFMLMRHWLNDRFARLSPMYNGEKAAADDAAHNLEEIVEWLLRLFDADFAAIYHVAFDGSLDEIARGNLPSPAAAQGALLNSNQMRTLRHGPSEERAHSSAYRALRHGKCEDVRDWNGERSDNGMSGSSEFTTEWPRSTVAAPIVVLGKVWGVIELVGFCSNQFDRISSMWLEEASQLVGNALYQTWLLKQITQANLAVLLDRQHGQAILTQDDDRNKRLIEIALRDKDTRIREIRNDICREMAELFIADGAALWLNNEQWPGLVQLSGHSGILYDPINDRPEAVASDAPEWPEINIRADDSLVAEMMREGIWAGAVQAEELDEPRGSPTTARDAYRHALWRNGVRLISLIPLLETSSKEETSAIGALTLYTKDSDHGVQPYGRRWAPLVEFAGRHVAMLMRSIALESERQMSLELMFSHEVIGSLRRVKDQFEYLNHNLLVPLRHRRQLGSLISADRLRDIDKAASRVGNGIEEAVNRLEEMRRDGFNMPSAGLHDFRSSAAWDGMPTVLYNQLQDGFNSRYRFRVSRSIKWRITGSKEYLRLKAPPRDLETLFYNLADNALKYSTKGSLVRVNIERRPTGNLYVDFLNQGAPLRPGEADRLFKLGFRGQAASNGPEDGSGQGLFITQRLAQALGVGLDYESLPLVGQSDVDHRFRLIFRGDMVVHGR